MSDERRLLERTAGRVSPPPDSFERVSRRRHQRHRNRRATAAVLAVAIAAVGAFGAYAAFRGGREIAPIPSSRLPWSRLAYQDPRLAIDVSPGQHVDTGQTVTLRASLPRGTNVLAGFAYRTRCGKAILSQHTVSSSQHGRFKG